jgi:hypothetical protein
MYTGQIQQTYVIGGKNGSFTISKEAEALIPSIELVVPAAQTNFPIIFALDVSQLKMIHIVSTKDCILETNSGGSPIDVFPLKANEPLQWWEGHPVLDNPFTADVTGLYITNTDELTFNLSGLYDPTL